MFCKKKVPALIIECLENLGTTNNDYRENYCNETSKMFLNKVVIILTSGKHMCLMPYLISKLDSERLLLKLKLEWSFERSVFFRSSSFKAEETYEALGLLREQGESQSLELPKEGSGGGWPCSNM